MKIIRKSNSHWIKGKKDMDYKKRILMNDIPQSVNLIQEVVLHPKGQIPEHVHKDTTEIFYITRGKAQMKIDGKEFELTEKDIIFIETGEKHCFKNNSNEDFEMIVLKINFKENDAILY